MSTLSSQYHIKRLLRHTSEAFYSTSGGMNSDYAEFAGLAISDFKQILKNPNLTRRQLVQILRASMASSHTDNRDRWFALVARKLANAANDIMPAGADAPQSATKH